MGNFDRTRWYYSVFKMDVTIWLSVLLAVITLGTPATSSEPRVVCYYTNWSVYRPGTARFNPQNINPYLCTHLIYAFGGFTKDNSLKPFDKYQDIEKGGYAKFTGLKTYNKNLKTLLAIGGWNEGSSRFSPMVASRERRKEFVRNAIKFLRQNRFDGLDLDWEYPAFRDGGKPKDREHYAKFVKELREEFDTESEKTGKPRLLLTMAVPAGIEYIQKGFDVKTLNRYLDWMNLLTYDYHSAFEPAVNHHAPLYPYEEPNEYSVDSELNIDYTIKFYLEQGADADKLVLGIPTYGRSYTLFNPDAVDLGSPADGPGEQGDATREKGYLAYYEICEALKPKTKKRSPSSDEDSEEYEDEKEEQPWKVMYPNSAVMGPIAYRGNQWVGYDDEDIVRKKAEYVADNKLGGIMFWSIDNDDFRGTCHGRPYPLIEAAKETYYSKLGSLTNIVAQTTRTPVTRPSTKRKSRPRTTSRTPSSTISTTTSTTPSTTTTTTRKPTTAKAASNRVTSTTPAWYINTPEPPTTPDPGADFKCVDEGFFPHPRDCKKYFWCLDSGPSNLGIVAHQFTCPSGLYFNKAADSCDFARNVLCKKPAATTKATIVRQPTTTSETTTTTAPTTRKAFLSTKNSVLFRTTTASTKTTPLPRAQEDFEEYPIDEDSEDPKVIKELIDLIRKVGGIEQLEKQLHLGESSSSTGGVITTTPSTFNKVYQKVLERTRGRNKDTKSNLIETLTQTVKSGQNNRAGPQNAGLEAYSDKDKKPARRERPQYVTINRQRGSTTTTAIPDDSEEDYEEEEEDVKVKQIFRTNTVEAKQNVATTAKTLQYVNIRRGRPNTAETSDTDDTTSRNALFERQEPLVGISETSNAVDSFSSRRETKPEYVTIRRQRPTTEEATTQQYQESDEEEDKEPTLLEKELSSRPKYNTIVRSTTLSPEEPNTRPPLFKIYTLQTDAPDGPDPTNVLAVQISSILNSPNLSSDENPEIETPVPVTEEDPTTMSTTTSPPSTTTTQAPIPKRTTVPRRRGPIVKTTPAPTSATQAVNRNFPRRTKATAPPETTEASLTDTETTTNRFTRRGNSKFKIRKELEKTVEKNEIEQRPSLTNGGARRYERPPPPAPATRKFVSRRRLGGANSTTPVTVSTTTSAPASTSTRRVNRIISRRRQSTTATTNATTQATTKLFEDEESLQDIGDTDAIEDPSLEPRKGKSSSKLQRRPLTLKDQTNDQNPSATNDEENKRQSKKYSASIKQNQLDDLVKKSQEESSSEKITTVEDISPETAVALAAHQLITAPVPVVTDFEDDDVKPTRNVQTTVEYKYSSREYNEYTDTDSRTPTYDGYQSTPVYKTNTLGNDETTPYKSKIVDFDSTKTSDFDDSKTTSEKYSTPEYKTIDYIQTTSSQTYAVDIDSPKITTYDVPKLTNFPNTASTASNQDYSLTTSTDYSESEYDSPVVTSTAYTSKSPSTNTATGRYFSTTDGNSYTTGPNDFASSLLSYLSKSDYNSDSVTKNYIRSNTGPESSTEFATRNSPSYVPNYVSTTYSNQETLDDTVLEKKLPRSRISTTLSPPPTSRQGFERTTTLAGNSPRIPSSFTSRVTEATRLRNEIDREPNAVTAGYSFVQRGSSRFRNNRLLPVPVDVSGYSTVGYSRPSQDPSYFTREYLLESPVTKTYDEEYQDLNPITTTPTPSITRKVIRKKIYRKISTTQRPTTTPPPPTPTTTVKPRRTPARPFTKVSKVQNKTYRPIGNYDYYDDSAEKAVKYVDGTKVVMHDNGVIECLDIGNFPHPTSCRKFISCARIDNGSLLGWEYICPKGLSFDPVGGICNWSAGLGCNEKET